MTTIERQFTEYFKSACNKCWHIQDFVSKGVSSFHRLTLSHSKIQAYIHRLVRTLESWEVCYHCHSWGKLQT